MAQLDFKCERCGKLLRVDSSVGPTVICSHCQAQVAVPRALASAPRPMVMGGARPMVAGGPPVAVPPPAVVDEDEPLVEQNSALAAMSAVMPWAVSIVFHIAVLLVMMFITTMVVSANTSGEDEDTAAGDRLDIPTDKYGDSDTPGSPVVTKFEGIEPFGPGKDKTDFSKPAPDLADRAGTEGGGKNDPYATIGIPVPGARGSVGGSGDGTGTGAAGNNPFGVPGGQGGGRGSKFFGSGLPRAKIDKIVYVVDNSGSMFDTFAYVKSELMRSINQLGARQQYQVLFFADGKPIELTIEGRAELHRATAENKRATKSWVDEQIASSKSGSTDPRPSLDRAFKIAGGPPQLIYLLTDGIFPQATLSTIGGLNSAKKVHINTIAFKDRTGEELLQKIAQENAGNYKFVAEEELGKDYSDSGK